MFGYLALGISLRQIAKRLGRHHTTLSRELSRNARYGNAYLPCIADRRAERVALRQRFRAALKNPLVFVWVREKLRLGWSPEIIAGRLTLEHPGESVHLETIYKYIYKRKNRREKLWRYLELGHKTRRAKSGRRVHKQTKIPNAVSIDLRPKEADNRKIPGHWETDNLEGKRTDRKVVSGLSERTTRKVSLSLLPSRKSVNKNRHIVREFDNYPDFLKKSVTCDNGSENAAHVSLTRRTGTAVFFCHPYHSWEKGTVERRFRTVRKMLPKGESLDNISPTRVQEIEDWLNNTPMKVLGYLTPNEAMANILTGKQQLFCGALQDRI